MSPAFDILPYGLINLSPICNQLAREAVENGEIFADMDVALAITGRRIR